MDPARHRSLQPQQRLLLRVPIQQFAHRQPALLFPRNLNAAVHHHKDVILVILIVSNISSSGTIHQHVGIQLIPKNAPQGILRDQLQYRCCAAAMLMMLRRG